MIIENRIIHYSELLEYSRDTKYSKIEIIVRKNKSLKNKGLVNCNLFYNLYPDVHKFISIQASIIASIKLSSKNGNINKIERDLAHGFLANFTGGNMVWLKTNKWKKIIEFELRNNINLNIPLKIKNFIENYYTLKTT